MPRERAQVQKRLKHGRSGKNGTEQPTDCSSDKFMEGCFEAGREPLPLPHGGLGSAASSVASVSAFSGASTMHVHALERTTAPLPPPSPERAAEEEEDRR